MTTYTLKNPVTFGAKTYDSLTFRNLKARDLAAADLVDGQVKKGFAILASMADVPIQVVLELDVDDLEGAQEVAAPFMGKLASAAPAAAAPAAGA